MKLCDGQVVWVRYQVLCGSEERGFSLVTNAPGVLKLNAEKIAVLEREGAIKIEEENGK